MNNIKIMIVDDHAIVRDGLKMIFETMDTVEVIGEASNGKEALDILYEEEVIKPDVLLLDLKMPVMNGIEFLREARQQEYQVPTVVLTTIEDQDKIQEAMMLGAKGYLLKDTSRDVLLRSIESAARGEMLLTEAITQKLFDPKEPMSAHAPKQIKEDFSLTERELLILQCVARGDTNRSIAIDLGLSERTIKAHLTSTYAKMQVNSRSEAVAKALANGIIVV